MPPRKELWKNLRVDCAGGTLISAKKLARVLSKFKNWERFIGSDHSGCFEGIASVMSGKPGEIFVYDVLGYVVPGRFAVFFNGNAKVVGEADRWLVRDAKNPGLRMTQFSSSTAVRGCADGVCAEDERRCWFLLVAASGRTLVRMADINCGGAAGREEGIRPCGPSCRLQANEITKFEPVFDGCNLEWKLHESTFGYGYVQQSSDEPRLAPVCAGVSGHFHNDHGIRDLIKSWKFGNWRGASTTSDDVAFGCCVGHCCGSDGGRGNCKIERGWSVSRCSENTLDV